MLWLRGLLMPSRTMLALARRPQVFVVKEFAWVCESHIVSNISSHVDAAPMACTLQSHGHDACAACVFKAPA